MRAVQVPELSSSFDAMSGCQSRPARPRSDQATSMNSSPHYPYGPRPPFSQTIISQHNTVQTQGTSGTIWGNTSGTIWGNPPMSPVGHSMQFDFMGAMGGVGCGRHAHHGFSMDELGNVTPAAYYGPSAAWNGPSTSDHAYHSPCQAQPALNANSDWPRRTSPLVSHQPFNHRGSWDPPSPPQQRPASRTSWTGPSRSVNFPGDDRQRTPYHPQPPARRSDWMMWVGNV